MNDVADYEYDLFVSYRRISLTMEWIRDDFLRLFRDRLYLELGRPPLIFWDDESVDDGMVPKLEVKRALRTSRSLLSILSGPYFSSPWCRAEWETFRRRALVAGLPAGRTLTTPVQWHDGDNYREILSGDGPQAPDFRDYSFPGVSARHTSANEAYQRKLMALAAAVANVIRHAPPYDPDWPLVEPEDTQAPPQVSGGWTYKLSGQPVGAEVAP